MAAVVTDQLKVAKIDVTGYGACRQGALGSPGKINIWRLFSAVGRLPLAQEADPV